MYILKWNVYVSPRTCILTWNPLLRFGLHCAEEIHLKCGIALLESLQEPESWLDFIWGSGRDLEGLAQKLHIFRCILVWGLLCIHVENDKACIKETLLAVPLPHVELEMQVPAPLNLGLHAMLKTDQTRYTINLLTIITKQCEYIVNISIEWINPWYVECMIVCHGCVKV